ncbi:DUF433 domain-containing protein [Altericista sp. CCNU0014]|uniref:DUF433 domain-containing protein n=1 Tax=Altericista sp. CCNU0014 TaxID=3082949 RepID=UPI003850B12C
MQTINDIGTLIVSTLGTCGGRPRIEGSRITVQFIINEIKAGVTPEEIVTDKPFLSLAGVYSAIAYYYANKDALDEEFAAYDQDCQAFEAELSSGTVL